MADDVLRAWAERAARTAREAGGAFASEHVDDIGVCPDRAASLADAAALVVEAATAVRDVGGQGQVGLAIPLPDSAVLDTRVPDLDPWPQARFEPPSLYYFEPRYRALVSTREEYRCPCPLIDVAGQRVTIVYACGRGQEERARDWEFVRTIWLWAPVGDA